MKNSFELAEKAGREDAVWFAHGVVAAAIKAEKLDVAKEWSEIEFVELQKHLEGTIEVPNQNNVHIWHTGYLMGVALIREDITKLEEAMVIAKKASLPKRIEQIKELMDGFEN